MKLIKPYFKIIPQQSEKIGMLKHIETCGRVAWKSEERTTDDSYIKFVDMLKGVNHGSVLEHGTVYLTIPYEHNSTILHTIGFFSKDKYSKTKTLINNNYWYITTNYRVLVENDYLWTLKFQCEPTEFHEKRVTVRFVCDRGVSHEFVRHRVFSFTQESTRYCNYSKDAFGNELTFILPCWFNVIGEESIKSISTTLVENDELSNEIRFANSLVYLEEAYLKLIEKGWKPQQARAVLPNSLKTELIMTGFVSDWEHFFKLRCDSAAHPQARELAIPLQQEFIKLNLTK